MKKESPLIVDDVQFCAFSTDQNITKNLNNLDYDYRQDFLIDGEFAGIAVRIKFSNLRYFTNLSGKGVRRKVSVILIDSTLRRETDSREMRVSMPGENPYRTVCVGFSASSAELVSGHTYTVAVRDDTASEIIETKVFHLYGLQQFSHPAGWYAVEYAGIRREGEIKLHSSLRGLEKSLLNVRFDVEPLFGYNRPTILPELEIRLYYPEEGRVRNVFAEPVCLDFRTGRYYVEMSFYSSSFYRGVYYAELLCMEYPIAGFTFSTEGNRTDGPLYGEEIKPLDEYTYENVCRRFEQSESKLMADNNQDDFR